MNVIVNSPFETFSETINWLQKTGYEHDFNIDCDCLTFKGHDKLQPEDFKIDKVYRFEGETDPGDENVVYAISSLDGKTKGILINAFGIYSDSISDDMIRKLAVHKQD